MLEHELARGVALLALTSLALASDPPTTRTEPARGVATSAPGAFDGYTLFSPLMSGATFLVDMQGRVVHRWDTQLAPGNMAYLLDDGHLIRPARIDDNPRFWGGGLAGRIQELDWDGKVVWDYAMSDDQHVLHHDLEVMPNGHLLATVWEYVSHDDAIALGRAPERTNEKGWWPDSIVELEPVKPNGARIVWEWHVKDHLVQDRDPAKPSFGSIAQHAELVDVNLDHQADQPLTAARRDELAKRQRDMKALGYSGGDPADDADAAKKDAHADAPHVECDWMHTNGIDYEPSLDLIAVSSPHLCEVFVIDHSTTTAQAKSHAGGRYGKGGDLLYRWGNPRNHGAGTQADQKLFYQHDPNWVAGPSKDEWHLTVFNNGQDRPDGKYSTIEEIALPFTPAQGFTREPSKPFGPAAPAWHYEATPRESMFSFIISGAQRLANGDTFVCVGTAGRFFEITRDGRIVWEYLNPFGGEIPHSFGKAAPPRDPPPPGTPPILDTKGVFQATRIPRDHPALKGRELAPIATR